MRSAGFIFDLGRCVGCGACVLGCRLANSWPTGVSWRRILPFNPERYGGGPTYHLSLSCHHCERPACMAACPAGAFTKRPDGLVVLHEERCIGCRYCEMACPFGALSYNSVAGVMTKCHLCRERIDGGLLPACVAACPTEALAFHKSGIIAREQEDRSAPGFVDQAGCVPNLGFVPPRGAKRSLLYNRLREALEK